MVNFTFVSDFFSMSCNIYWKLKSSQNENVILTDGESEIYFNEYNIENFEWKFTNRTKRSKKHNKRNKELTIQTIVCSEEIRSGHNMNVICGAFYVWMMGKMSMREILKSQSVCFVIPILCMFLIQTRKKEKVL